MAITLTTDRLILRPHTADDHPACCALWSDPEVTRFIGGRPATSEEVLGDTPEAGWVLLPQYQGRGLAREALTAMLAWADQTMPRTACMIDPANAASLKLAEKLGYTEYARTTYKDYPTILLARTRQ